MNVCVVGCGPSGLYTSRFLLKKNFKVTAYESKKNVLESFKCNYYTKYNPCIFSDVFKNKNFVLKKNEFITAEKLKELQKKFDAFFICTGSTQPKKLDGFQGEKVIYALDIIRSLNRCENDLEIGKDIVIVGCGNVAIDIVKLLFDKKNVQNITVLCRSGIIEGKFTNAEINALRLLEDVNIETNFSVEKFLNFVDIEILKKSPFTLNQNNNADSGTIGKNNIDLIENCEVKKHNKVNLINEKYDIILKNQEFAEKGNIDKDFDDKNKVEMINKSNITNKGADRNKDIKYHKNQEGHNKFRKVLGLFNKNLFLNMNFQSEINLNGIQNNANIYLNKIKCLFNCLKGFENHRCARNLKDEEKEILSCSTHELEFLKKIQELTLNELNILKRRLRYFKSKGTGTKKLKFSFNTSPSTFIERNNKVFIKTETNSAGISEGFDNLIISIGYNVPNKYCQKINKPVFYVGWCKKAIGNLNDLENDAYETTNKMYNQYKKQMLQNIKEL